MSVATEPLRKALLEQGKADAARILALADDRAAARLAAAEEQGRALVEQARSDGIAAAMIVGARDEAQARRRARALALAAQRELYDELGRRAREAAQALRHGPGYERLLEQLAARARTQLGEDAVVELDPPGAGGVRASAGARHVDYTLDALVERCLGRLGATVERLWDE